MFYSKFKTEDFIADEYFIQWVKSPNEASNEFWNAWLSTHPEQKESILKAKEFITLLDLDERKVPEGKFLELWQNIAKATAFNEPVHLSVAEESSQSAHRFSFSWIYRAAAAILVCALSFWGYKVYDQSRLISISTAFGESRTLFLPDSTKVTLNANSSLRYFKSDFDSHQRKVTLNGQAFFAVTHQPTHENFKVYTDELQVEVLGTRFDVNSRRGTTKVILEEGKVRLDIDTENQKPQSLIMKPGDLVEVAGNTNAISRTVVNTSDYLSWRNNRIEFIGSSLEEIGLWLEDNYGYEVVFEEEELKNRKFTGSSSSDDLSELFQKLVKVFDLEITQNGTKIILRKQ